MECKKLLLVYPGLYVFLDDDDDYGGGSGMVIIKMCLCGDWPIDVSGWQNKVEIYV